MMQLVLSILTTDPTIAEVDASRFNPPTGPVRLPGKLVSIRHRPHVSVEQKPQEKRPATPYFNPPPSDPMSMTTATAYFNPLIWLHVKARFISIRPWGSFPNFTPVSIHSARLSCSVGFNPKQRPPWPQRLGISIPTSLAVRLNFQSEIGSSTPGVWNFNPAQFTGSRSQFFNPGGSIP